jgi:hypothetical protein
VNVSSVSGCHNIKVGTSIDLACLPCQPACLVSLLALFVSTTIIKVNFCEIICLEQSTSLRYL